MKLPLLITLAFLSSGPALAQPLSTEDIVRALDPSTAAQTRSLRGIAVEPGEEPKAPSIDLTVNFAYDSAKLQTDALLVLKRLGAALNDPRLKDYNFVIAGYTDARGSNAYNQKLSEERASAVRNNLIFFYDIAPQRLAAIGYGESHLADPAHPDSGINRRVEIVNRGIRQ
jgi:outer membrane protein OmpA-like peptidoglycan-associated protein